MSITDRVVVRSVRTTAGVGGGLAVGGSVVLIASGGPLEWGLLAWMLCAVLCLVGFVVLVASYGIAVGRYRLYDIDLFISHTLVYGTLAVSITGVYVTAVVGVGRLAGNGDRPHTVLAVVATAAVAAAFQPLRRRLQHVVDHLVFGRKATPHEVLSEFSRRAAANDDALLEQVARSLVEGTAADRAGVWVPVDGLMVKAAEWPEGEGLAEPQVAACPIEHDGVPLGQITLSTVAGQDVSAEDVRLARQVAAGMGLALHTRGLTGTLRGRVAELRESRRRLVTAQDAARRRIERDLHDGAQQQLVALRVKLGLARAVARRDGAGHTAACLDRLADRTDDAVEALRDVARGVYPPLLEAEGLGPAIAAQARRLPTAVRVEDEHVGRYDPRIEATVYFCVMETLHRLTTGGVDGDVRLLLAQAGDDVTFEIVHDRRGAQGAAPDRDGLVNIDDRLDAAGGGLSVCSDPDGITVRGWVPTGGPTARPSGAETADRGRAGGRAVDV